MRWETWVEKETTTAIGWLTLDFPKGSMIEVRAIAVGFWRRQVIGGIGGPVAISIKLVGCKDWILTVVAAVVDPTAATP